MFMKKTLSTVVLFTAVLAVGAYALNGNSGSGGTTRYWDGCKPSCGWAGKQSENGVAASCNSGGTKIGDGDQSACQNGPAYTCMGQVPWAVDNNKAYGFAASHTDADCGKCFELRFTSTSISGKTMVVMISNIGGDVNQNNLDLMIPGGGVGAFNALSNQIKNNGGPQNPNLGVQYGGFRATCGNDKACVRRMCEDAFPGTGLAHLKAGCLWYVDWYDIADNPNMTYTKVNCPQDLIDVYKGTKWAPTGTPPPTTNYTLTLSTSTGGTVTGGGSFASGTSVNPRATPGSGYVFANWTVVSGTAPSGVNNSTQSSITFNMPGNSLELKANFTVAPVQTYTLTVNRNNTNWGTTNPTGASSRAPNSQVSITATPATNYKFKNWTVSSGTAPSNVNNSTNATLNFNMPSNDLTLAANFEAESVTPPTTNYTLTLNPSPTAGGSVSINDGNSSGSFASGAWVTAKATVNPNYNFQGWTATQGTMPQGLNAGNLSISFNMPGNNLTLQANFTQINTTNCNPSNTADRTDTTKIEAEDYTSKNGDNIQEGAIEDAGGGTCIGYINNGNSATYKAFVPRSGAYPITFRVAGEGNIDFSVSVNGSSAGSVTRGGTGGWNTYVYQPLPTCVQLTDAAAGNTIVLNFGGAVNVDHFLILGEKTTAAIRYNWQGGNGNGGTRVAQTMRAAVTLKASPSGFTAVLPSSHAYTSYRLIDLQGREVRSGKIGNGVTSLNFNNTTRSVLFLKLEGKGIAPAVLRAVTY